MMNYYLELGFRVQGTKFFGLGERVGDFLLNYGNYTILPSTDADFSYDRGKDGFKQGYGMHPFLVIQTKVGMYIGIYLANTHAI
jgi:hypothetical protein